MLPMVMRGEAPLILAELSRYKAKCHGVYCQCYGIDSKPNPMRGMEGDYWLVHYEIVSIVALKPFGLTLSNFRT